MSPPETLSPSAMSSSPRPEFGVCLPASQAGLSLAPPAWASLGRRVRSAAQWSLLSLGVRQLAGLATTSILARLVFPEAFGLVAMVTVLTAFLSLLDVGLGWATVQAPQIDQKKASLLFWLGAFIGGGMWGLCVLAGPLVARFYGRAELAGICAVLGAALMCNSLGTQPAALLKRGLRQGTLSLIETSALLAASATAVSLAVWGAGHWALVAQVVMVPFVRLGGLLFASQFRPGRGASFREAGDLVRFGGYYGMCTWVAYFQLYLDSILVGHCWGAEALGLYSRAVYLKTLPTMYAVMTLNDVMVPALSSLRNDPEQFAAAYRKALRAVAFFGCPLGAFLGVAAPEVVRLLYGPAWDPVVPLLRWLALSALALPVLNTVPWLFIATGKGREFLRLNLLLTPMAVVAYGLAARGGPSAMACVNGLAYALPIPLLSVWYAHRAAGLSLGPTVRIVASVGTCCLAAVAAGALAGQWAGDRGVGVSLAAKLAAGGTAYLASAWLLLDALPLGGRRP